jgi:hypothetical protein
MAILMIRLRLAGALVMLVAAVVTTTPAGAANKQACTIIVGDEGILKPSVDLTALSSKGIGGRAGEATITATNSSYSVVVESPYGFTMAPPDGAANTIFDATISGRGATDFFEVSDQIPVRIKRGTTALSINLTATKLAGNFTSGNYRAETTIRCE